MKNLQKQFLNNYSGKDLEQRKHWYSPAAQAYEQLRPRYPQTLIHKVIEIAQLSPHSKILEVGCGPAVATPAFSTLGCSMICIEPNPDFYRLAQQSCQSCPHVRLQNCSFEEWSLESQGFDAVLAASSFHWIPPEIGYPKAAAALKPAGFLILLSNTELQPSYEIYQQLEEVYQKHSPFLKRSYEDITTQLSNLNDFGQMITASELFKDMITGHIEVKLMYSLDQYLRLLNTYSPFLTLEPQRKQSIFEELQQILKPNGPMLQLSHVSAFHIAQVK